MDIKIDFGPWEQVFVGTIYGHAVEILSNPEHFFLVFIYDEIEGRKVGAVVEGYKAFIAKGQLEPFLQTLPKPCLALEKNTGEKTTKIFFLSFEPFYVDFKQEDYVRRIDLQIQKSEEYAMSIIDLARASSLDLKELALVPRTEYAPIIGDPFVIKSLIGARRQPELAKISTLQETTLDEAKPAIQLGLSKKREIIKEAVQNLFKTQVIGKGNQMNYALYILSENLLLENIPLIIFDSEDYFTGLGVPAPDATPLKDELVGYEPIGFPFKQYSAKEAIKISLKDTDMFFLLDMLGLGDEEFMKNFSLLCFTLRAITPDEMLAKIQQTKELNEYEKLRAERIIQIISKNFQGIFGESTAIDELVKVIPGKFGIATVINTRGLLREERILFTHTILRQLAKGSSKAEQEIFAVMVPGINELMDASEDKTVTAITRLADRGLGVILGSEKDLPQSLNTVLITKINMVAESDAAVSIKGKRNYRVILRPSLSGNPKKS